MTLLDRFRTQARHKHPDPAVRLAYVSEIPLDERDVIGSIAREDEDPRVRRAAVAKLMDPALLGSIARDDADESVRGVAAAMLRDLALEAFEGISETESLEAVDVLDDPRTLALVAKTSIREIVALRALSRVADTRTLGSIARHAASEGARRGGFERVRERGDRAELLAIAMNGDHKDTAVAAVDLLGDRADLDQIAARGRNKSAVKRARAIIREADEPAAREAADLAPVAVAPPVIEPAAATDEDLVQPSAGAAVDTSMDAAPAAAEDDFETRRRQEAELEAARRTEEDLARRRAEAEEQAQRAAERHRARLTEVAAAAEAAAGDADLPSARKRFGMARREWKDLSAAGEIDPAVASRYSEAESRLAARDAEAKEADARARREALGRLHHLLGRVEPLIARPELSLKAADRALREVRAALGGVPPLPSKQDYEEVTRRLKAAQAALTPKLQELREADEWHRWANVGIQEQLCARMEALRALDDPEAIARAVRELQEQWRQAADVPRAQADALWRRFKAAHDEVWARCEAHFAAEARARAENLAKKVALCEKAEALADSTNWIQTAEEIKRLQAEWKTIGPVSRGREKAIWDRFRAACDRFFTRRHDDLAHRKAMWAENLAKKDALCAKAEALADSTDWEHAAAEIKRLQAEWKTIGPVKKTRSEAIWQRFRGACDRFFARYAQRHDLARVERVAAREAICAELESLGSPDSPSPEAGTDLLAKVRTLRGRWQQEIAARGVDPERAQALDQRFNAAFAQVVSRWPTVFGGTDLDPEANRRRMEAIVKRIEDLAASVAGPIGTASADEALSPTTRLAAMLKEALAANTIGGKVDEDSRLRAAAEEVRHAQANWSRLGPVPEDVRRSLADRFYRACRRITERAGKARASLAAAPPRRP